QLMIDRLHKERLPIVWSKLFLLAVEMPNNAARSDTKLFADALFSAYKQSVQQNLNGSGKQSLLGLETVVLLIAGILAMALKQNDIEERLHNRVFQAEDYSIRLVD